MAQLSDDCFAFEGPLLTVAEAERLIAERIAPVEGTDTVEVGEASGRVLAQDLIAPLPLPSFDNSAVDGYAVRYIDLASTGDTRLPVRATIFAGQAPAPIAAGTAVRIFTGAPMPQGADTVFMQEDCRIENETVILPSGLKAGANRRVAGEDIARGAVALARGRMMGVREVALAAALGLPRLAVRRRVRVALFSTGDEVVEPGAVLPPAGLYDANRAMLRALLVAHGATVTDLGILRDRPDELAAALSEAASSHDLIVTSGGVSMGDADYVRVAIETVGRLVFWRLAIKPGRPVALGVIGAVDHNAAFAGLPGNPVAVYVTFARVLRPLLLGLAGASLPSPQSLSVRAAFTYKKKPGRREYVRVRLVRAADGMLEAFKFAQDGAGVITSLTQTDGLAELPEELTHVAVGDAIGFLPYAMFNGVA